MSKIRTCSYCINQIPPSVGMCPHCGRPSLFPNVEAAQEPRESEALERRYQAARTQIAARGYADSLTAFENDIENSVCIMARSVNEVQRLASSDNELYSTYYQLIDAGVRLPVGDKWDKLRPATDSLLFPGYKEHIRFAALSLGSAGLSNYGECSITLRTEMIAHRASVFEENTVLFMKRRNIQIWDAEQLPEGHRATWENRGKLCVAKLSDKIGKTTTAQMILSQGATSEEDEFIEVHIWGPITARTFARVIITAPENTPTRVIIESIRQRLENAGVEMKVK